MVANMTQIDNILPRLIQEGRLVDDLSSFTDDELKLGLMMMIDNLERYDETLALVEFSSHYWRKSHQDVERQDKDWARALDNWKETEPVMRGGDNEPWKFHQGSNAQEKTVTISEMNREDVEKELRSGWRHLERAREGARLMGRVMEQIKSGHWFAPEVPNEVQAETATTSKKHKP